MGPLIHILIVTTGILLLVYALLILYYHRLWDQIPIADGHSRKTIEQQVIPDSPVLPKNNPTENLDVYPHSTTVSIIIPARNEASNIDHCLNAIFSQSYPKNLTEIIVVNDFSTDETASRVLAHADKCRLLNLTDFVGDGLNSYKKKAIETGIRHSSGELIICTDADCSMGVHWIDTLVSAYEKQDFQFIAAPVKINGGQSALSIFQTLDFISLQGITGAAVSRNLYPMCNGANLAYTRKAYESVNGFQGIDHIASGDDMLLMKKIQEKFPGKCGYIKDPESIVRTAPAENIKVFLDQRIRWASKISHYQHPATFVTLALVFLMNLGLLLLFISCFFYGHWRWLLILIAFKTLSEYFFVSKVAGFFQQQSLMKYFPLCQPFHILYTVIAGSFGSFGRYEWKNRKVK